MNENGRETIHYTEVPDPPEGSPIDQEWMTFRRELPRLLAEGHEGKFALVKGGEIVGLFETHEEGMTAGYDKFLLGGFMLQPILSREPVYRLPWFCRPCRT